MEQLTGLDAMFIHAEQHGMPMHISSFSVYDPSTATDGNASIKDVIKTFQNTCNQIPVLKSKLIKAPLNLDQPYWVEMKDFDVEAHIHKIALPAPGDWTELRKLIAHLHAQPLNREMPLWEVYLIEGVENAVNTTQQSFGIFLKVHHSIMDGATGMELFSSLHSLTPYSEPIYTTSDEQRAQFHNTPVPTTTMLGRAVWHNSRRYFQITKLLAKAVPIYKRIKKGIDEERIKLMDSKPHTRFNDPLSAHRSIDRFVTDFDDIRAIKHAVKGATVNEVALAIISGALRKYLDAKHELPDKPLAAGVPINCRADGDNNDHGNVLSMMNVCLRTDIEDPLERLEAVHLESCASKEFANLMGPTLLNELCDAIYSGLASWTMQKLKDSELFSLLPPANHTVVSNISGPPIPFYFSGCKMVDSFGLGPLIPGTGLFHTISSSDNRFSISVTACSEMMPDIDFYASCLAASFAELLSAANKIESQKSTSKGSKKSHKKKKPLTKISAAEDNEPHTFNQEQGEETSTVDPIVTQP